MLLSLAEAGSEDPSLGGKAANMARLARAGLPVPDTFIVPDHFLQRTLENERIGSEVQRVLALHPQEEDFEAGWREVQSRMLALEPPPWLVGEIAPLFNRFDGVIVRSSAASEDGAAISFAGQLRSFLTRTPDDASRALFRCWASLFEPSLVAYAARLSLEGGLKPHMSVLVQEWVEPRVSGVSFTSDQRPGVVVSEAIFGNGELLMHGLVSPDRYTFEDGQVNSVRRQKLLAAVSTDIHDLHPADLVPLSLGRGLEVQACVVGVDEEAGIAYVEPPFAQMDAPTLTEAEARQVAEMVLEIHALFGAAVDVEWVIGHDGRLTLVQARPCTRDLGDYMDVAAEDDQSTTVAASPGRVEGELFVALDAVEARGAPDGAILVTPVTTPDYMSTLLRVSGVVAEQGGLLSHTAIVCRELGLPCLVGVVGATERFTSGHRAVLDADRVELFELTEVEA